MVLGLKGKVAMVAGASSDLGLAVARVLASEGAKLSIASNESAIHAAAVHVRKDYGGESQATFADVRSSSRVLIIFAHKELE